MVLESYSLAEMRTRIRNELGISDSDTSQKRLIDDKINEAISLIVRRRPTWPWQLRNHSVDISEGFTDTCSVTNGSREITTSDDVTVTERMVMSPGENMTGSPSYLVTAVSGADVTLEHQYLGETDSAKTLSFGTGYLELPEDCLRADTVGRLDNLSYQRTFTFQGHTKFEKMRRCHRFPTLDYIYTVRNDPLALTTRLYVAVFPYLTDQDVIRVQYYADPPKLVEDEDVPMMPANDRPAALYKALELYALMRSDNRAGAYHEISEREIDAMLSRYRLSQENPNEPEGYQDPTQPDFVSVDEDARIPGFIPG